MTLVLCTGYILCYDAAVCFCITGLYDVSPTNCLSPYYSLGLIFLNTSQLSYLDV